jgi:hypothetical protein
MTMAMVVSVGPWMLLSLPPIVSSTIPQRATQWYEGRAPTGAPGAIGLGPIARAFILHWRFVTNSPHPRLIHDERVMRQLRRHGMTVGGRLG